jgi:aminoacylase
MDEQGRIFARGSQDMKCVGMQYLEAIRRLRARGVAPLRTVAVSFVPDEEIGGHDGMGAFVASDRFRALNVGLELDEGWATPGDTFPVFYAERCPWWFTVRATGEPGHGSKLYDGGAMERLQGALARIFAFRAQQFDRVKVRSAAAACRACCLTRAPACSAARLRRAKSSPSTW